MDNDLIERYRDINVDYGWWDGVYAQFSADMKDKHILVSEMSFSGFWSQGDGASFTGHITDIGAFLKAHDLAETYPTVTRFADKGGTIPVRILRLSVSYVHENTVYVVVDHADYTFGDLATVPMTDFREAVIRSWDKVLDDELGKLEGDVQGLIRMYCSNLYRRLEEEHTYLTSDEAVWETITANELEKENT